MDTTRIQALTVIKITAHITRNRRTNTLQNKPQSTHSRILRQSQQNKTSRQNHDNRNNSDKNNYSDTAVTTVK